MTELPPGALDPDSDVGRRTADAISDFEAEVLARLRREGRPLPTVPEEAPILQARGFPDDRRV